MVSIAKYIENGRENDLIRYKDQILEKFNEAYFSDQSYQDSMRQFTSNASNVKNRIEKTIELVGQAINE